MTLKCKKFVIFANKKLKINMLKIRTIVFIQWNIQVLHIVYVIESIVYLKKFLYFSTMDLTMIIILSLKIQQKNLKKKYLFRRKYWKIHKLFSSNSKKITIIDKIGEKITKTRCCRLQINDRARFMASLYQILLIILLK